jgi:hypothetical protein
MARISILKSIPLPLSLSKTTKMNGFSLHQFQDQNADKKITSTLSECSPYNAQLADILILSFLKKSDRFAGKIAYLIFTFTGS